MKKTFKWIGIIFGVLIVIGILGNLFAPKTNTNSSSDQTATTQISPTAPPARVLINATAGEIAKAYEENTVSADMTFKGKTLKIVGVVTDINTDFMGRPYITLKGGVNQFMEPQFSFPKEAMGQLAEVRKGKKVTVICTGAGDVAKTPMMKDCSF